MTKKSHKKARRQRGVVRDLHLYLAQVQCPKCGRYRMRAEQCWYCNPPAPEHCHCDDLAKCHVHLDHHLLERLWQVDLESVDETILLDTDSWPDPEDERRRQAWRDDPEWKAFIARNPDLRRRSRMGIDSIFAFFGLNDREADAWALESAGYTVKAIAHELGLKEGGALQKLDSAWSKIGDTMRRMNISVKAG